MSAPVVVRIVHVIAVGVVLGGALLVWLIAADTDVRDHVAVARHAMRTYERAFWVAVGVVVMTGVGNLGAFGPYLQASGTVWGRRLTLKLWSVAALVVLSLTRTLAVVGATAGADGVPAPAWTRVRALYAVTAAAVSALVALALLLAHA